MANFGKPFKMRGYRAQLRMRLSFLLVVGRFRGWQSPGNDPRFAALSSGPAEGQALSF